jgi:hypothetical protein
MIHAANSCQACFLHVTYFDVSLQVGIVTPVPLNPTFRIVGVSSSAMLDGSHKRRQMAVPPVTGEAVAARSIRDLSGMLTARFSSASASRVMLPEEGECGGKKALL